MSRKRPGAFRNLFGQPEHSDLLDVPGEERWPPTHGSESPPQHPEAPPAPALPSEAAPTLSAALPSGAELPDVGTPPPPLSLSKPDAQDASRGNISIGAPAPRRAGAPGEKLSTEDAAIAGSRDDSDREDTDVFEIPESSALLHTKGISEPPTEVLPRRGHESALANLQEPTHPPLRAARPPEPPALPAPRSLPHARKKPGRPRPPGAFQRVQPAEKGAQLLARVHAGESIHDHAFFDAELPGASLIGADLSCGQLQRVNFSGADLRHADLSECDLRGADLSGADMRGANLQGCRLELTRLEGTDLRYAQLEGLDFSTCGSMVGADLRAAELRNVELSAPLTGARIDHRTHAVSGWSVEHLAEAHQLGLLIETPERLPQPARQVVLGVQEGMVLRFTTPLSFQDRFVLCALISAVLGPDCTCTLDNLSEERMLIGSENAADLTEVAEALSARFWEEAPTDDAGRALSSQLGRILASDGLRNELSSLIDRTASIELYSRGTTLRWLPPTAPREALKHLLLKLFIPVELRWWLAVLPGGKSIVRSLPSQDVAPELVVDAVLAGLEQQDRIDPALFSSLIEERRRREAEIRAVAALCQVTLP